MREHRYKTTVTWTGNRGVGTRDYRAYGRDHSIAAGQKPTLTGSADPAFRGDAKEWNPEDLFVAALSGCHQLWYLHLCADAGIVVTAYVDDAEGIMAEGGEEPGKFTAVTLRPRVTITDPSRTEQAIALHDRAHKACFVANSVSCPVTIEAEIVITTDAF
ncbi:MAG: OsmC family protein [Rhodospirillaceae bacterium]